MKYLLPIFFSIFFVACFGINKDEISQNNSLKYPSWYLNPPLNDGNILYGVGVANTKQEAILNALDDLSSRLMLTIQSNQEISLKSFRDYREYVSKTTTFNINTKSEKLTFKDYKIEDFYSFQKDIFYLISIKKSDLINSLNSFNSFKIACDIPSGLNSLGQVIQTAFKADITITMGALKTELLTDIAKDFVGKIKVANLGLPEDIFQIETNKYIL